MAREIKVKEYPVNREQFLRNKKFAIKIRKIAESIGAKPVIWGSLAFFGYTQSKKIPVNDFDYLINRKYLKKLREKLWEEKIEYLAVPSWNLIIIEKGDLKVEFDCFEDCLSVNPKKFVNFDFNGFKIEAVSKNDLARMYKLAAKLSKDKPKKHLRKYMELMKI